VVFDRVRVGSGLIHGVVVNRRGGQRDRLDADPRSWVTGGAIVGDHVVADTAAVHVIGSSTAETNASVTIEYQIIGDNRGAGSRIEMDYRFGRAIFANDPVKAVAGNRPTRATTAIDGRSGAGSGEVAIGDRAKVCSRLDKDRRRVDEFQIGDAYVIAGDIEDDTTSDGGTVDYRGRTTSGRAVDGRSIYCEVRQGRSAERVGAASEVNRERRRRVGEGLRECGGKRGDVGHIADLRAGQLRGDADRGRLSRDVASGIFG